MSTLLYNKVTKETNWVMGAPPGLSDDWLVDPDLSAVEGISVKFWVVDGDSIVPMPQDQQDAINAAELPGVKDAALKAMTASSRECVARHYDQAEQTMLVALLTEAIALGFMQRVGYIGSALAWVKSIVTEFYKRAAVIVAATDAAAVEGVSIDFSAFEDADPHVTLIEASSINM